MRIVGIDPGLHGAVALLISDVIEIEDIPIMSVIRNNKHKHELDERALVDIIRRFNPEMTYVEQVGPMPKQGVSGVFSFGCTYGAIRGILAACHLPVDYITPMKWKRAVGLKAGATKDESRRLAVQKFPRRADLFARVKDDGRAEAALIAWYGTTRWTPLRICSDERHLSSYL